MCPCVHMSVCAIVCQPASPPTPRASLHLLASARCQRVNVCECVSGAKEPGARWDSRFSSPGTPPTALTETTRKTSEAEESWMPPSLALG